eukprot:426420-Prymnesium_polylepis.1
MVSSKSGLPPDSGCMPDSATCRLFDGCRTPACGGAPGTALPRRPPSRRGVRTPKNLSQGCGLPLTGTF